MDAVNAIEVRVVFTVVLLALQLAWRRKWIFLRNFRWPVEEGTIFEACLGGLLQNLVRNAGAVLCRSFCAVSISCSVIFIGLESSGFLTILGKVPRRLSVRKVAQSFDRAGVFTVIGSLIWGWGLGVSLAGRRWNLSLLIWTRILFLVNIELRSFNFCHFLSEQPFSCGVSTRKIAIIHWRCRFVVFCPFAVQLCIVKLILSGSERSLIMIAGSGIMGHLSWPCWRH